MGKFRANLRIIKIDLSMSGSRWELKGIKQNRQLISTAGLNLKICIGKGKIMYPGKSLKVYNVMPYEAW
jgi:hypothetical protein